LPNVVCIDVGASYYPHPQWINFLSSKNTTWVAVEPNKKNVSLYAESWNYDAELSIFGYGLSEDGGQKILYVTNIDSGSSLLKPVISEIHKHRVIDDSYYFPVNEVLIETKTLSTLINHINEGKIRDTPLFVKLDTQGTELSIIKGAREYIDAKRIIGIELESTLLQKPLMIGSGKFWEANKYLEESGFELLKLNVINTNHKKIFDYIKNSEMVNECDAVFALRLDIIKSLSIDYRMAYLNFLVSYDLYNEINNFIFSDQEVLSELIKNKSDLSIIKKLLENKLS
jgi:FkbM family methyltransferase